MVLICQDGQQTCHGEEFSEAVTAVASSAQVVAIGVNCTHPNFVEVRLYAHLWDWFSCVLYTTCTIWLKALLQSAQGLTDKPFVVYPNSGEDWNRQSGLVLSQWMYYRWKFSFTDNWNTIHNPCMHGVTAGQETWKTSFNWYLNGWHLEQES